MYSGGQRKIVWIFTVTWEGVRSVLFFGFLSLLDYKINLLCNFFPPLLKHFIWEISKVHFLGRCSNLPWLLNFLYSRYKVLISVQYWWYDIPNQMANAASILLYFFFKGMKREREKMADLFLFVHLFFKFILKGEVLCSLYFPLTSLAHEKKCWISG